MATTRECLLNRKQRKELARQLKCDDPGLEVVHPNGAGIDVGNGARYVAVRPEPNDFYSTSASRQFARSPPVVRLSTAYPAGPGSGPGSETEAAGGRLQRAGGVAKRNEFLVGDPMTRAGASGDILPAM